MHVSPATAATPADPRFVQLRARDAAADGTFVYAVRSTGVFCRPSCPARQAKPTNVTFFDTAAQAEAAGYRACLRCRPGAAGGDDTATRIMRMVADYIERNAEQTLTLKHLGSVARMSPWHLQRSFKAAIGISPKAYQSARRLGAFKSALRSGQSVLDATFEAGYGSTSRAYEQVDGRLGMTPSAYRAGGAGETIVFATRDSSLGPLMMAASARGVCFVQFGEGEEALRAQLASEFPRATLRRANPAADTLLEAWMTALDAHLAQGTPCPAPALDLRGTEFQLRAWSFLASVPAGSVATYRQIAEAAGAPGAMRAAGSACAANRIAVLIPCHRALRADGGLGGYRWGLERKRALLDAEAQRQGEAADQLTRRMS